MPPIYKGRRDLEQEAEDKRLQRISEREALDYAAVRTRAALLKHMGKIMPGQIAPPAWETYRDSPGVSGNSAMTDYILRYNAKNPQRPFQPEVYLPQARPAAPAVAPAAAPRRVMANAPAVGVQAGAPLAPQSETAAEMEKRTSGGMEDALNAQGAVQDIAKKNLTPDQMNERASAVQQSASGAQQSTALDETSARQRVLNRDFTTAKPDGRRDVVYGWAGYGGTGRQLVSVPRDERNGQAYSDARREFYRKHEQDRADAYAGTMQRGQKPSAEGLRAWNKANPFNSDMYERDARAYADAAVAPRAVAFNAPPTALSQAQARAAGAPADAFNAMRLPDGSLGYARPGGSPTLTTGRSASATMPDGKVERTVFTRPSATPITDAVTNAGIGLDSMMVPGAGAAMRAGAMAAGAANLAKQNPSTPAGANTADPDSIASQAKAATNATAPQPITSAVKTEGTGAADDLTFAGLDPNLSEDEKAKKRGELLAAKYKPTP